MKKLKLKKPIIIVSVLAAVGVLILVFGHSHLSGKEIVLTKSALEKIVKTSELSTAEVVYNSVLKVHNEKKPEQVDYFVSYDATVKVGIDFEEIEVDEPDTDNKIITVRIPKMKITEVNVDPGSLDFIFNNKKLNTYETSVQAQKLCGTDAEKKAMSNEQIMELARENTESLIKGLIEPLVEQLDEKYTVNVVEIEEA